MFAEEDIVKAAARDTRHDNSGLAAALSFTSDLCTAERFIAVSQHSCCFLPNAYEPFPALEHEVTVISARDEDGDEAFELDDDDDDFGDEEEFGDEDAEEDDDDEDEEEDEDEDDDDDEEDDELEEEEDEKDDDEKKDDDDEDEEDEEDEE